MTWRVGLGGWYRGDAASTGWRVGLGGWYRVIGSGATTYTLSAPTYVPGSLSATGLTARVTVTAA